MGQQGQLPQLQWRCRNLPRQRWASCEGSGGGQLLLRPQCQPALLQPVASRGSSSSSVRRGLLLRLRVQGSQAAAGLVLGRQRRARGGLWALWACQPLARERTLSEGFASLATPVEQRLQIDRLCLRTVLLSGLGSAASLVLGFLLGSQEAG